MSDENAPAVETTEEKPKRKRGPRKGGPRKTRTPSFKDWIRVVKSQGNGCPNTSIELIFNKATNVCTLVTNAPATEDTTDGKMEGERRQIFKVFRFEQIDQAEEPQAEEPQAIVASADDTLAPDNPTPV